ncbi:7b6946e4-3856-4adf-ba9b-e43d517273b9-CDS [Sclerotinia trifoliorum]|uniref:7b6946e4-3856-4adf-ba9b-e43d517273b9-CDS n=1 Tax=Sclerotinia trifoliorum TaxID=28548 RepID=A0A8H2VLT3_9HELO|nr:7b6946e4-3856-4adf-ba9b-e43d517273b9-CDS [Sclerotinia trifoliorum]
MSTKDSSLPTEAMDAEPASVRKILDAKLPSKKRTALVKVSTNTTQPSITTSKSTYTKPPNSSTPASSEATSSSEVEVSSSESSSEDESEDEIPLIRPLNARPVMRVSELNGFGGSGGLGNLPDFLKQMKEANEELMKKISGGEERGLEDVREGESYVEMNLGLGVLEEKRDGDSEDESESEVEEKDADGDRRMGEGKKAGIEEL